jgi:WD40 repeat protein
MRDFPVYSASFFALLFLVATAAAAPAGGGFIRSIDLGHGAVTMLSMTSDGSFVSAATQDGTILMLSRNTGPVWHYFNSKSNSPYSVAAIHPSGTSVLGGSGSAVFMLDNTGAVIWSNQRVQQPNIDDVALSANGYGYTASNSLYYFDKFGNPLFTLNTASSVWRFAISTDGAYIVTGTADPDHKVRLYDWNETLHWTYDPQTQISDVDVSYQGLRVAAGAGQNLYVFSYDGTLLGAYDCGSPINGISMSGDGKRIAVGTQDGNVKIISDTGVVLWQNQTSGKVYDVALSSDGTQLAVAVGSTIQWFAPDISSANLAAATTPAITAPGTGAVIVSSVPAGAGIYVDNSYRGIAPLTVGDLSPGDHAILLKETGYSNWSTTVTVIPDTAISLSGSLSPAIPVTPSPDPVPALVAGLAIAGLAATRRRPGKP